jgi:hypothetical protein
MAFPPPAPSAAAKAREEASSGEMVGGAVPVGLSPEEMAARLAERIEVPEAELLALGDARARAIREWLLASGGVAGARVFVVPVKAGGTRATLNLK